MNVSDFYVAITLRVMSRLLHKTLINIRLVTRSNDGDALAAAPRYDVAFSIQTSSPLLSGMPLP